MLFICESARVKEKCVAQNKLMNEDLKWMLDGGVICKGIDKFLLDFDELCGVYEKNNAIYFDSLPRGSFDTPVRNLSSFKSQSINVWSGTFAQLNEEYLPLIKSGYTIAIMAGTSRAGQALAYDIPMMCAVAVVGGYFCVTDKTLARWEGAILFLGYIGYIAFLVARG